VERRGLVPSRAGDPGDPADRPVERPAGAWGDRTGVAILLVAPVVAVVLFYLSAGGGY
jgi:hypothetical protein